MNKQKKKKEKCQKKKKQKPKKQRKNDNHVNVAQGHFGLPMRELFVPNFLSNFIMFWEENILVNIGRKHLDLTNFLS